MPVQLIQVKKRNATRERFTDLGKLNLTMVARFKAQVNIQ